MVRMRRIDDTMYESEYFYESGGGFFSLLFLASGRFEEDKNLKYGIFFIARA